MLLDIIESIEMQEKAYDAMAERKDENQVAMR